MWPKRLCELPPGSEQGIIDEQAMGLLSLGNIRVVRANRSSLGLTRKPDTWEKPRLGRFAPVIQLTEK
jgi:hypothetical protein